MCISAQDAYASEEEVALLVASYFFVRLGSPAEAFPLPNCNSKSQIMQVILRFNLTVFHFAHGKNSSCLKQRRAVFVTIISIGTNSKLRYY